MIKYISLILILLSLQAQSQLTNNGNGARGKGMADATINLSDVWSIQNNIAGLAKFEGSEAGVFAQNRFSTPGFNSIAFVGAHQLSFGTAGLSISRFGDNLYNESVIGLGVGHKMDFVSLGLKANLLQVAIQNLGSKQAIAIEFGGIVFVNDELSFGANVYNINQAKIAEYNDERFSTTMKIGVTYHPYENLFTTIEAEKDIEYKQNIKAGIEYFVIEKLAIRTGFSTLNNLASFGLGLKLSSFKIDYAISLHNKLGLSNSISLNYIINKKMSNSSKSTKEAK